MSEADPDPTSEALIANLKALLDVEEIDTDLYRGARQPGGKGRVFGGQVIAQALMAATRSTSTNRIAHSLHAYFMRPGDEDHPIIYRVSRDYDGGSFSTRRIIAFQQGKPILNMAASFQANESGFDHQADMPPAPDPETLPDAAERRRRILETVPEAQRAWFMRPRPFDLRPVSREGWLTGERLDPSQLIWFRATAPVEDDATMHRAMLAYASDMYLLGTAMRPHGINWLDGKVQTASLDHALWLHADFRIDDWLLYVTDSPWAGGARGFNRGTIYTRDGRLVASVAQEGLIRSRARTVD